MASQNRSPQHLNRGCMCNWGPDCLKLKKLFAEAGDVSQTRMIPIKPGASDASVVLRSLVKFLFKLGPEYHNADFFVAAHHWPPALIERNYKGSKSNRPSRQFKTLLTRSEAASYDCAMDVTSNNFASCLKRAGVSLVNSDKRRLLFLQGPTNTLHNVRSISTSQSIRHLEGNKMHSADTVGEVKAVDPIEALLLRRTTHRNSTIKKWRSSSRPVAPSEVTRFEGSWALGNQTLGDFFFF
jgi:hypothetical protein